MNKECEKLVFGTVGPNPKKYRKVWDEEGKKMNFRYCVSIVSEKFIVFNKAEQWNQFEALLKEAGYKEEPQKERDEALNV